MKTIGRKTWAVPEGYLPPGLPADSRELVSHEALCILNTGRECAHIELTVFFTDCEPSGPYRVDVPPRRTLHLRLDDLTEPEKIPRGKDFSTLIESTAPVVIQHTRLDSRQAALGLLSTIAYGSD